MWNIYVLVKASAVLLQDTKRPVPVSLGIRPITQTSIEISGIQPESLRFTVTLTVFMGNIIRVCSDNRFLQCHRKVTMNPVALNTRVHCTTWISFPLKAYTYLFPGLCFFLPRLGTVEALAFVKLLGNLNTERL